MTEKNTIHIGDQNIAYTITRSHRRRRSIAFVMESPTHLKITAPVRASLASIQSVLHKQTRWILRRLLEFQRVAASPQAIKTSHDQIAYLGHACQIIVTRDEELPQGCVLKPHRIFVNIHGEDLGEAEVRLEILLWLKKRAKIKMQRRMDVWAKRLGVSYRKLVLANAEQRWGSCNPQNVIRLNWRLILAPLPILDYVIVHELCHVRHKNHGAHFWAQVASAMPDWKIRRKTLRLIGGGLVL